MLPTQDWGTRGTHSSFSWPGSSKLSTNFWQHTASSPCASIGCLVSASADLDPKFCFLADFCERSIQTNNVTHSQTFLKFHRVVGRGHISCCRLTRPTLFMLFFLCSDLSGITSNSYLYPLEWSFYFQVKLSRYIFLTNTVFLLRNCVTDVGEIMFSTSWHYVRLYSIHPCRRCTVCTYFEKGSIWEMKPGA